jgi:NAD(P)-dependent dehydrogenase (short-subunit alcohol dehydrogenase family)
MSKRMFSVDLSGKVSLVTGAGGYFGSAFAKELLENGSKVVLFDKDDRVVRLSEELADQYGSDRVQYYKADFYDEDEARKSISDACETNASLDILVNNAFEFSSRTGFNDPSGRLETISRDQWMRSFDSGVYWHAMATQVVGTKMKAQGSGSIINISSMYAVVSPDPALYAGKTMFNPPAYSASKAAFLAFTRYVASFYGEFGIRCNAILAGAFPHVGIESDSRVDDQEFLDRLRNKAALNRTGVIDDLLGPLLFLASDASKFVTGHGLSVDGGWTIR